MTGGVSYSVLCDQLPEMRDFLEEIFNRDDELLRLGCYCQKCFYYRPLPV